ncbi:hypothetical protein SKAU_G00274910 [Synaphobranchus kaupii]|uniref:Uncharacterized protein n=1 Tax=Synaphobranchus kaupii TaxID=118154 RepID=A0A9Q1IQR9_SYNKA|nr:hypothetical protein SKAU_G00274910 [Synaphobranchus kaupii]
MELLIAEAHDLDLGPWRLFPPVRGSPAASALAPARGPCACSRPFLTLVARTCSELRTGLVPVQPPPGSIQAVPFPVCLRSAWLMPRHSPPVWFLACPAPASLTRPSS